ncbi:MAG: hypothetical protein GY906_24960 [bacterium]|nr:hypothetical protein [bacterium]
MIKNLLFVVESRHRRVGTLKWSRWMHDKVCLKRGTAKEMAQTASRETSGLYEIQGRWWTFDRRKRGKLRR